MNGAIDLARGKKVAFRVMRSQVIDYTIFVKNPDGTDYDFTGHTAQMFVYNSFSKTDTPEYTITVTLAAGSITFSHPAIAIKKEEHVYQLWITDNLGYRQVWLNGPFLILNSEVNHFDDEEVTFSVGEQAGISFEDEGSALGTRGTVTELDFVGAGVVAARSGNKVTITVSGNANFRGVYVTLIALQSAVPTGNAGDYADVDAGVGTDIQRYIWDVDDAEWILGGGAPLTLTDGNGTTANGTAVDLGGPSTKDTDIEIPAIQHFLIKELSNNTFIGYHPGLGGMTIGAGDPTVTDAFTGVIASNQDVSFYSQGVAGSNGLGFDFGQTNGAKVTDYRVIPKGIETAASGYVTGPRSYADKEYVDAEISDAVTGLLDDRGNYNASVNTFPASGGSGTAGAIMKGDLWTISVAGTLGGVSVTAGDVVRALTDTPGQTASNWVVTENNIGYVPENNANKSGTVSASATLFPTHNAVIGYAVPVTRQVSGRALSADITTAQLRTDLAIITTVPINALASGSGVQTLTNMTNVEMIFPAGSNVHLFKFDGTNYATVRITCRVSANSASVNDPRLYMQYSTDNGSNWITIGAGTSVSGDALSLASTNNQAFTNWVTLPAGAKADVLFRVAQNGGDGAADPAVCSVYVSFRT